MMRKMQRLAAVMLVIVLCAPAFLYLIPKPALSAEEARLFADLQTSFCSTSQNSQGEQAPPATQDMCCVLCTALNHATQAADHPLAIAPALEIRRLLFKPAQVEAPTLKNSYRLNAPRGPPAL